jgi:hypothetical protein
MTKRPRKVSFTPGLQGSPCVSTPEDDTLPIKAYKTETVTQRSSRRKTETKETRQVCNVNNPLEIPRTNPVQPNANESQMSVHEKLAAVEDEARAAQNERKERESRKRSRPEKARPANRRRSTLTTDELDDLMGVAR